MKILNLTANTQPQEVIKSYLEENVSDVLAEKINNGVKVEKDGKTLINKKTLDGFMNYANEEARKIADKGATCACLSGDVVFGWAIHYFEEDSIEEKLYNEDGTEYKPKSAPKKAAKKADTKKKAVKKADPKPKEKNIKAKATTQISVFDLL